MFKEKFVLVLLIISFALESISQQIVPLSVLNSGGNYSESSDYKLYSSIGESIVAYSTSDNGDKLNSGFLQNLLSAPSPPNNCNLESNNIPQSISPSEPLSFPVDNNFKLTIFHRNGNVLYHNAYSGPVASNILSEGNYLYVLSDADGRPCIKSAITIFE